MEKVKENALNDFMNMIRQSWTWARLTDEERGKFIDYTHGCRGSAVIRGTYKQRWDAMNALYGMFLEGLGYRWSGWREEAKEA